jgi:flagellin
MPNNSINTNVSALVALQYLNATNRELDKAQDRVSTGLRVNSAIDDASSFAIAQGLRADLKGYAAVSQGIANGKGVGQIGLAGLTSVSDLLGDIQGKITEGLNAGNTTSQQNILQNDYASLIAQINTFISNANYNGRNLLSSGSPNVGVIANIDGTTLVLRGVSQCTQTSTILAGQSISTTSTALVALTQLNSARATIASLLGNLGADIRSINFQDKFVTLLDDSTTTGLGDIVDADLAKESARLQALQVKQQLGVQTLNIANARPQILGQLFR